MKLQVEIDLDHPNIEGDNDVVAHILHSLVKVIASGGWGEDIREPGEMRNGTPALQQAELRGPDGTISARFSISDDAFDPSQQITDPVERANLTNPTTVEEIDERAVH